MNQVLRIAFVEDRYDDLYGAQVNVLSMASICQSYGHQVHVLTTGDGRFAHSARMRGLNTTVVVPSRALLRFERVDPFRAPMVWLRTAWALVKFGFTTHRAIGQLDADVVVANSLRCATMLWLTGAMRRPPIVLWVQNDISFPLRGLIAGALARRVGLISGPAAATFTRPVRWMLRRRFRSLPSGRSFAPIENRPLASRTGTTIVTICSITPRKGIHCLIDAVARAGLGDVQLVVVGGTIGPASEAHLASLQQLATDRQVDTNFVGWQDDVGAFLALADIFVLASEHEGLPGVLLEAMGAGVACITTRAGAGGEMVERCEAGLAVEIGDVDALAEAINRLATDPQLRGSYGAAGARNVRATYSLEASYRALAIILDEVVRRRTRPAPLDESPRRSRMTTTAPSSPTVVPHPTGESDG